MEILILGGGVTGISTAYQLLKDGYRVTVIDRNHPGAGGASFGNAGLIAVGHSIAWGSPRALKIWFKTLFHDHPVFRMNLRLDPQLVRWGLKFIAQCTNSRAVENSLDKHRISKYSQKILNQVVAETGVKYDQNTKGLLFLYRNQQAFEEGIAHTLLLKGAGQKLETADKERVLEIIPELQSSEDQIVGGIFSPNDESGDSRVFCEQLMDTCRNMGGIFMHDVTIERLETAEDLIKRVVTNKGVFTADRYVLCLGSWSPLLVRSSLGIRLPIYPVKGYSITVPVENHHTPPSIGGLHEDDFLGFATMGDHFRISSVSEFSGYDVGHTPEDFEHIFKCAKKLFPNAGNYDKAKYWSGLRPMTPEGTPILGTGPHSNLYYNTGHGHLGWTMSSGTARITADLIGGKKTEIPVEKMGIR